VTLEDQLQVKKTLFDLNLDKKIRKYDTEHPQQSRDFRRPNGSLKKAFNR